MKDLLPIKEVLKILKITRNTLLKWEEKNLLTVVRHPINRRRYYKKTQVDELVKTLDQF